MNNVNITIIQVLPPTMLGNTTINLNIGDSVTITPSMLMASNPNYSQPQGYDIGSIHILGTSDQEYQNILDYTHSYPTAIARLKNGGDPIGRLTSSQPILNDVVTQQNLYTNTFIVEGINVGSTNIYYVATAWDGLDIESEFNYYITGMITINVNSNINNPPSNLLDSNTVCVLGSFKVLNMSLFSNGYVDPEGDPIANIKIFGVYLGSLTLNGLTVTTYPLIVTPQQINSGALIFKPLPNATLSSLPKIEFTVSDTGSGQYL